MADCKKLIPFILKWEGGYVNDPDDLGGPTNRGITYGTFCRYYPNSTVDQLKNMSDEQWLHIFKSGYWDKWQADRINNQYVANILVDWVWASGGYGIKLPQKLLGVFYDGIVGEKTLSAVNSYPDQKKLFDLIKAERIAYVDRIVEARPKNKKFRQGWLNRINDIKFTL